MESFTQSCSKPKIKPSCTELSNNLFALQQRQEEKNLETEKLEMFIEFMTQFGGRQRQTCTSRLSLPFLQVRLFFLRYIFLMAVMNR